MRTGSRALAGAIAGALLLTACGNGASTGSAAAGYIAGPGVVDQVTEAQRRPAPHVEGQRVGGGRIDSADYRGKILVYNVWGSWCPPCRAEAPALRQVATEKAADGVQFLGINIRDNEASARAFERRFEIPYPSLFDPSGQALLLFRGTLPPNAIPSTVVVDRRGRVAARIVGGATYGKLRAVVDGVLAEDR